MKVTWFSIEILKVAGKRTYFDSLVIDLAGSPRAAAELAARGAAYRFFECPRTIVAYFMFDGRVHLLHAIAATAIRPP